MEEFQRIINERLAETGMSRLELSRKADVNRGYLYEILSGRATPSIEIADRIADALGLAIGISEKS